jgi:hypothetical protein
MASKDHNFPNKNFGTEFIETYNKEVTPERINDFKMKLAGIETLAEKLAFCKIELMEYLQNIPAETMAASGNVAVSKPIFFDRIIQTQIDFIEKEIATTLSKNKIPVDKKLLTYNWTGKKAELIELHKAMKGVFIDKKTNINDFCSLFDSVDTNTIKSVKWIKTPTDLLLFLYEMMENGLIVDERDRMKYKRLQACFLKADGSQFDESFSSIFQQIKNNYTAQKPDIKELVKQFK